MKAQPSTVVVLLLRVLLTSSFLLFSPCDLLPRHSQMFRAMETTQIFCVSTLLSSSTLLPFKEAYSSSSWNSFSKMQIWVISVLWLKSSVVLIFPHWLKCHRRYFPNWSQPTSTIHRVPHQYSLAICSHCAKPQRNVQDLQFLLPVLETIHGSQNKSCSFPPLFWTDSYPFSFTEPSATISIANFVLKALLVIQAK